MKKIFLLVLLCTSTLVQSQVANNKSNIRDIDKEIQSKIEIAKNVKIGCYCFAAASASALVGAQLSYDRIIKKEAITPKGIEKNRKSAKTSRTILYSISGVATVGTIITLIKYIDLKQDITLKKATIQAGIMDSGNVGLAINF